MMALRIGDLVYPNWRVARHRIFNVTPKVRFFLCRYAEPEGCLFYVVKQIENMTSTTGSDAQKAPTYTADEKGVSRPDSSNGDVAVGQIGQVSNFQEVGELKQGLKQRHIQMIALAGAIGTVSLKRLRFGQLLVIVMPCLLSYRVCSLVQEVPLPRAVL